MKSATRLHYKSNETVGARKKKQRAATLTTTTKTTKLQQQQQKKQHNANTKMSTILIEYAC